MKKQIKEKWVKALRSGSYQQGRHQLACASDDGVEFCCLGVLKECLGMPRNYQARFLSPGTLKKVGFEQKQANKLASMNDKGLSFKRIAAWIERWL